MLVACAAFDRTHLSPRSGPSIRCPCACCASIAVSDFRDIRTAHSTPFPFFQGSPHAGQLRCPCPFRLVQTPPPSEGRRDHRCRQAHAQARRGRRCTGQRDGMGRLRCLWLSCRHHWPGVLPLQQPHRAGDRCVRHVHRGLPGTPAGRHGLRAPGRPLWAPEGTGLHHDHDGAGHLRHRPDSLLRTHRHLGTGTAAARARGAGLFHRWRVWWRGNVHRRVLHRP